MENGNDISVKNSCKSTDLEEAISIAGIGLCSIRLCFIQALFLISSIIEAIGYSYILPAAKCDLNMTDAQRGLISSLPYIAIIVTSFLWGYLVDTRGRKRILIYSSLISGTFSMIASFMPDVISFTACKFIASLCLACPSAVPYTFIGEILPQKYRDIALSITNAMQSLGAALVPLLAWAILPLDFRVDFGVYEFRPWRLLSLLYSSIIVISAVIMIWGPESPKYLVSQGKDEEALKVLQTIYAGNQKKSPYEYPVQKLNTTNKNHNEKVGFLRSLKVQTLPLLLPPYLKWLALNGFLLFGIFSVLNGLFMWVPDVLNRVLSGDGDGGTACQVIKQRLNETANGNDCDDTIEKTTFIVGSVANISCAFISLAISISLKLIGKKALMVLMYFILGIFSVIINFIAHDILFAILLSFMQITAVGIGPINAYSVEIFPTHLRGMAVGLTLMLGRSGSVVGANLAGALINSVCEATFFTFGGLLMRFAYIGFAVSIVEEKTLYQYMDYIRINLRFVIVPITDTA